MMKQKKKKACRGALFGNYSSHMLVFCFADFCLLRPSSTPKYRSHSGLCVTKKLSSDARMDGVVVRR